MSLTTPDKIRDLQIKLYRKAKNEPGFRFYQLYDKVYREDILLHAYRLAKANDGAPGVDGESFEDIESGGREEWLNGLRKDLHEKTYEPQPVRRKMIDKPGGGERPWGIPTLRDRVAQTAAKLVLEPIGEADLEPNAYGYRGPSHRSGVCLGGCFAHVGQATVRAYAWAVALHTWAKPPFGRMPGRLLCTRGPSHRSGVCLCGCIAHGRGGVRRMRYGRWMSGCIGDIRISWTRICPSTSTRFQIGRASCREGGKSW